MTDKIDDHFIQEAKEQWEGKCVLCGHPLEEHIDEGDGWRCHSISPIDGRQCECYLRTRPHDGIEFYDAYERIRGVTEELDSLAENIGKEVE